LQFRDDDIVIATYAKAGTTWMQQIISQLLFEGDPELEVAEMSPWMDLRVPPKEVKLPLVEAQVHRRFMKTHLPVDALNNTPGRVGPPVVPPSEDIRECGTLGLKAMGTRSGRFGRTSEVGGKSVTCLTYCSSISQI
jgi:hypothetical protein